MSTADQIRVAELTGAASHHAKWRPLAADERDAAAAAPRELAAGRADLLAQVAGLLPVISGGIDAERPARERRLREASRRGGWPL